MSFEKLSHILTRHSTVNRFFGEKNVFFVLGLGRSGTRLLADLLNRGERSRVFHEPVREDFGAIVERKDTYIRARMKTMYFRLRDEEFDTYGEVNSNLRYHAAALKNHFPYATLIHNIRDGREVVRSIMSRAHYTNDGIGHHSLRPLQEDPYYDMWGELSRFQKVCWLWKDAVEKTEEQCEFTIKFENWTQKYNSFDRLLRLTGIKIPEKTWREAMNTPNNRSPNYSIPHWKEWDEGMMTTFNEICGDLMKRYGYL